jgi:hypothetical protein
MYLNVPSRTSPVRTRYAVRGGLGDVPVGLLGGAIGAGVQLAVAGAQLWLNSIQLSHIADTATTQIVNGLEPLLRANVAAFQAGPMTQCSQQVALASFDQAWQWLTSSAGCGNGQYGSAGNACISDRQRGGKWDWFSYYRDPIATASVTPNTACPGTTVSGSGQQTDVTNDSINLLPGQGGDQYFALLEASGQGNTGVIPTTGSGAGTTTTGSVTTTPTTSILGGLTMQELLIPAAIVAALLLVD